MTISEVKNIVNQPHIPSEVRLEVVKKASTFILDEQDVEVVVSESSVVVDVYNDFGTKIDSFMYKVSDENFDNFSGDEVINEQDICGLSLE